MAIFGLIWMIWFIMLVAIAGPLFFDNSTGLEGWFINNQKLLLILSGGSFLITLVIYLGVINPLKKFDVKKGEKG